MPTTEADQRIVISISELNRCVRELLDGSFLPLWVEGESSNFARPTSGHMYFSLKDANAQVRCAMFRNRNQSLAFRPENGMQVLAKVRVSLYEPRGEFQLIAEEMEEAGDGALRRAFEALKKRLAEEGLFDAERKRPIPELPEQIGVITSPTGAAVRDVLSVLQRRFPAIPVVVYPVPVQGEAAAPAIVKAIRLASERNECDVLLLVRGGGSLEDLWAFNEESVARAIVASTIPIVCGVGHEIDVTIADFTADVRAPTPSAAAELITPDQYGYLQAFADYEDRLTTLVQKKIIHHEQQLRWLQKRLEQQHPLVRLQQQYQRLDGLEQRLLRALQHRLRHQHNRLSHLTTRLLSQSPAILINNHHLRLANLEHRLYQAMGRQLEQRKHKLATLCRTLNAMSPLSVLSRGYSILSRGDDGQVITESGQVKESDRINARLHKGGLVCRVEKIIEP